MNVIECTIPLKESHVQAKKIRSVDHLCWLHMISAEQTDSLPHQLLVC